MTEEDLELASKAQSFAEELSGVLAAFIGQACPFVAKTLGNKISVTTAASQIVNDEGDGVPLRAAVHTVLSLAVQFWCTWDSQGRYLRIESSKFAVAPPGRAGTEPLFRYEFEREPQSRLPCAHLHVHAHRDAFTHLLGWPGPHSKRAKSRGGRGPDDAPAVSEFHFPLGGARFRPSLEDVLDVLREEFGLETGPDWPTVRDESRADWRRIQLAAAVRDAPGVAVRVLQELGYQVSGDEVPEQLDKLTKL